MQITNRKQTGQCQKDSKILPILLAILLSSCASSGQTGSISPDAASSGQAISISPDDASQSQTAKGSRLEQYNRTMYKVNDRVDEALFVPLVNIWRFLVPQFVRTRLNNIFANLKAPQSIINSVLQVDIEGAMIDSERFLINSTLGLGGMFDVAAMAGTKSRNEDFGQTLGVWGVPAGPFIVLPLLGPSTLRGTAGNAVDTASSILVYSPTNFLNMPDSARYSLFGLRGFDTRERLHETIVDAREMSKSQIDPYTSMKRFYLDYTERKVNNVSDNEQYNDDLDKENYEDLPDFDEF